MVQLRTCLPPYVLYGEKGEKVYLPDLKGKILVLVRDPGVGHALALRRKELSALEAQAFLLAPALQAHPLPLLLDPQGELLAAIPEGGVVVTDPYLEVCHVAPGADVEEVLAWVRFVAAQCPECVLPEGAWTSG